MKLRALYILLFFCCLALSGIAGALPRSQAQGAESDAATRAAEYRERVDRVSKIIGEYYQQRFNAIFAKEDFNIPNAWRDITADTAYRNRAGFEAEVRALRKEFGQEFSAEYNRIIDEAELAHQKALFEYFQNVR